MGKQQTKAAKVSRTKKLFRTAGSTPHPSPLTPPNRRFDFSLLTSTFFLSVFLFAGCSFDYGPQDSSDSNQPDIVMDNVEYVRMRNADPVARFQAERAERYEERRVMELRNFSFEQFGNHGADVNAYGRAGSASVELESGDIRMGDGVRIEVESEDFTIETRQLEWKDKARTLIGGSADEVNVSRANGTKFTGIGFSADARRQTWEFAEGVGGTYIHDDEEEETVDAETAGEGLAEDEAGDAETSGADGADGASDTGGGDAAFSSGEDAVMPQEAAR
ncbi:MAG: LPS export ABC transporter periplasmic protein LptC [Treponema sp.]|nr:LPS export ABC transporter periplasmic protein LptC [Treponema sp.]